MARYVSTLVQCDKCYKVVEIDFSSEGMVDRELEELGWSIDTGDDFCPDCKSTKEHTEERDNDQRD